MILKSRKCLVIIKLFWRAGGAAVILEGIAPEKWLRHLVGWLVGGTVQHPQARFFFKR
jgi:hypothetical protein